MIECVDRTGPKCCLEYFGIAWLIMSRTSLKNSFSEQLNGKELKAHQRHEELQEQVWETRTWCVTSLRVDSYVCYKL